MCKDPVAESSMAWQGNVKGLYREQNPSIGWYQKRLQGWVSLGQANLCVCVFKDKREFMDGF